MALYGCDTFVVLPPLTRNSNIIFGKNSDRPNGEVQEIVYEPSKSYVSATRLQCTYIDVDQVESTRAVLLSKPAWMWGAEMGANSCGVVIGNEAVWTNVNDDSFTEKLLGMDLLRLGLERSSSSQQAVDVITLLLEKYGQGGPCSDIDTDLVYHNSFLIADPKEVWVLETAGHLWAAEQVTCGLRNISNCLSIGTNISKMSTGLIPYAKESKLWSGKGEFNFKDVFSAGGCPRELAGRNLLVSSTEDQKFDEQEMFGILRNKPSGICRPANDPFSTTGSWVSSLSENQPACHWVTGTPDPSLSVFKPFVFSENPSFPSEIVSPTFDNDPAKNTPRFQFEVDRRHKLYLQHEKASKSGSMKEALKKLEYEFVKETKDMLGQATDPKSVENLLTTSVKKELALYEI